MGITRTLWKVVRRPMTRWWVRNGSWWLLGIAVAKIVQTLIVGHYLTVSQLIPFEAISFGMTAVAIVPIILLLVAATICDGFIYQLYEQQAAPIPRDILWSRYLLALFQGVPIAITILISSLTSSIIWSTKFLLPSGGFNFVFFSITGPFSEMASTLIIWVWLVLFIVLASKKPLLKYGVVAAYLFSVLLYKVIFFVGSSIGIGEKHFLYPYSEYILLSFVAMPLWLLFANAMKQGKFKLANTLHVILMISIIVNMSFVLLYEQFGGSLLYGLAFATEIINSAFFFDSRLWSPLLGWLFTNLDYQETVLGYLPYLLQPILAWARICLLLGLIYWFVFKRDAR